jgi:HSP20 family protein
MTNEIAAPESVYPWNEIDRAFDAVRRQLFEGFGASEPGGPSPSAYLRTARTDVEETDSAYRLHVEVPGIPKENLAITIRGNEVEVRGEFSSQKESKEPDYVHRERTYAGFYRSLELPEPVVASQANATVENGVLTLELPKEHPEPTPTEVKVPIQ